MAPLLKAGGRRHHHTFGHDRALARLFAPTRQHEGVDVKRMGNILHGDARHLAQADGGGFELRAVARGGAGARVGMGTTPDSLGQGVH